MESQSQANAKTFSTSYIQLKDELRQIKMDAITFLVRSPVSDSYPVTNVTTRIRHIYMISEEAELIVKSCTVFIVLFDWLNFQHVYLLSNCSRFRHFRCKCVFKCLECIKHHYIIYKLLCFPSSGLVHINIYNVSVPRKPV